MSGTSPHTTATVQLCALSEDALVEEDPGSGSLVLLSRWGEQRLNADAAARDLLRRMGLGPVSVGNVSAPRRGSVADSAVGAGLDGLLDRLGGAVVHCLGLPDGQPPLMSATPVTAQPRFRLAPVRQEQQVRLSRFASLRPVADALVLESPLAPYRVVLHDRRAVRVATGLTPATRVPALAAGTELAAPVVADIVAFLAAAGVVVVGEAGEPATEDGPTFRLWSHHELLFHVRSRTRQRDGEATLTDNAAGWPVTRWTKDPPTGPSFPLPRPDLERLARTDPALTTLLERDHLCPKFTTARLTAAQVGELLFRAARVRAKGPAHMSVGAGDQSSQRPYFNVASRYELELYVTVNRCVDLPTGIFHYDPVGHALTLVRDDAAATGMLLDLAKVAAANSRRPAALITVTARMGRVAPLFAGAAYAAALMHVGALQQTLHLCGRAMKLSVHAVVADASDTVDRVLNLDWPAEAGVGECVVDLDAEYNR